MNENNNKYVLGESTLNHIDESLMTAADSIDGALTKDSYEQWRKQSKDSHASVNQIVAHSSHGDTWGEICRSYGITVSRTYDCTKKEVLEALRRAAKAVGEPLSNTEYDNWQQEQDEAVPTPYLIWKNFDEDWKELCDEAGVQAHSSRLYTREEITSALRDAAVEIGEPLVLAEYRSWATNQPEDRPGPKTIKRQFENWETACRESDVEPHPLARYTPSNPYPLEEITTAIQTAAEAKGEPLSASDYEQWRGSDSEYPSKRTCLRRFNNWKAACEEAGLTSSPR